ncbi:hypothetical protein DVH24_011976 [Malus domestica]|uniref:RNase H type-1 domain-containing protein n=1 Tax=Malus domestica TaxID=3750 RepID=A0A498JGZ9_MALDO|nr:hypothetical protein DVH24_011976 [Malus domestica]
MCGAFIYISVSFIVNDGQVVNPTSVSHLSKLQLAEFVKIKPALSCWCPPSSGWVKNNVDGSFLADSNLGGVGVVFRDEASSYAGGFVCYVRRATNVAVHCMAKLAISSTFDIFFWFEEPPNLIVEALIDPV